MTPTTTHLPCAKAITRALCVWTARRRSMPRENAARNVWTLRSHMLCCCSWRQLGDPTACTCMPRSSLWWPVGLEPCSSGIGWARLQRRFLAVAAPCCSNSKHRRRCFCRCVAWLVAHVETDGCRGQSFDGSSALAKASCGPFWRPLQPRPRQTVHKVERTRASRVSGRSLTSKSFNYPSPT